MNAVHMITDIVIVKTESPVTDMITVSIMIESYFKSYIHQI